MLRSSTMFSLIRCAAACSAAHLAQLSMVQDLSVLCQAPLSQLCGPQLCYASPEASGESCLSVRQAAFQWVMFRPCSTLCWRCTDAFTLPLVPGVLSMLCSASWRWGREVRHSRLQSLWCYSHPQPCTCAFGSTLGRGHALQGLEPAALGFAPRAVRCSVDAPASSNRAQACDWRPIWLAE